MRSTAGELLEELRAPEEEAAEARAWQVVRSAYAEREALPQRRGRLWRIAPVPVAGALALVIALSAAGAAVHGWITRTLGARHAHPALISLPAPGRLLVSGATGAWTVSADGTKRRLGPWPQASWSPHGIYVLLAAGEQLVAADPRGSPHWSVSRPAVRFPRWYAPTGYRVAYLSGRTLRVIAGDGTGDTELAAHVARVAPSWRPGHPYELAYVSSSGWVVVRDTDTKAVLWSRQLVGPTGVSWSANGSRLLVVTRRGALVFDANGLRVGAVGIPGTHPPIDGALSPDGSQFALLSGGSVTLTALTPHGPVTRRVFAGAGLRQLAWSPDGRWLLVTWPPADEWVFIRVAGSPRDSVYSRIAEQFGGAPPFFPHLDGWCCTSGGSPG